LIACGPSPQDLIEQLASADDRECARQQFLLAKQDAVEPLLAALGDDDRNESSLRSIARAEWAWMTN